jgi:hypothetical protein
MMPYMIRFTVPTADTVGTTENGKFLLIKDYEKEMWKWILFLIVYTICSQATSIATPK